MKHLTEIKTAALAETKVGSVYRHLEIKAVNAEERTFEGLAAAFSLDFGGDVIMPGAFKRTLIDWRRSKGRSIKLLDSHQAFGTVRSVIGKPLELEETDEGLAGKFWIIDGPDGDEIVRRLKAELVDGLSIGYKAIQVIAATEEEERRGIFRKLKEVALREISIVVAPMNPDARIDLASVKHLLDVAKERDLTDDEREDLKSLHGRIGVLLDPAHGAAPPPPAPASVLAPGDPRRVKHAELLRDLMLGSLSVR